MENLVKKINKKFLEYIEAKRKYLELLDKEIKDTTSLLKEGHIWLLDDKYMNYKIKKTTNEIESDIVVFVDNIESLENAVIVEVKKTETTDIDIIKTQAQVGKYAQNLIDSGCKSVYVYIICDITEKIDKELNAVNFFKIFSSEGYIRQTISKRTDNNGNEIAVPIFIISYNAILSNAKNRINNIK